MPKVSAAASSSPPSTANRSIPQLRVGARVDRYSPKEPNITARPTRVGAEVNRSVVIVQAIVDEGGRSAGVKKRFEWLPVDGRGLSLTQ